MFRFRGPIFLAVIAAFAGSCFGQTNSLAIGNSLTQDAFAFSVNPELQSGLEMIAASAGLDYESAPHVRCSSSLATILNDPATTCVTPSQPYGTFDSALPGFHWDRVTLQPHPLQQSTMQDDIDAIQAFIDLAHENPANDDTVFFIYSAWPSQVLGAYASAWLAPSENAPTTSTSFSREYFENLLGNVRDLTDAAVQFVPAGEVLYEIDQKIAAGTVAGVSDISHFYRDNVHLSDDGRYVAATTMFSVLFKADPRGVARPAARYGTALPTTPGLDALIQQTVWEVVSAHPAAGLGDMNDDELVDHADLSTWNQSFGIAPAGAPYAGHNFLVWQRHMTPPAPAMTIPEPAVPLASLFSWVLWSAARPQRRPLRRERK